MQVIFDELNIKILIFKEITWVAQCLEYDIATQGKTIQDALDSLERTILGQIHLDKKNGIEPLSEVAPLDSEAFRMMLVSEGLLSKYWDTPEEDEAWKNL